MEVSRSDLSIRRRLEVAGIAMILIALFVVAPFLWLIDVAPDLLAALDLVEFAAFAWAIGAGSVLAVLKAARFADRRYWPEDSTEEAT